MVPEYSQSEMKKLLSALERLRQNKSTIADLKLLQRHSLLGAIACGSAPPRIYLAFLRIRPEGLRKIASELIQGRNEYFPEACSVVEIAGPKNSNIMLRGPLPPNWVERFYRDNQKELQLEAFSQIPFIPIEKYLWGPEAIQGATIANDKAILLPSEDVLNAFIADTKTSSMFWRISIAPTGLPLGQWCFLLSQCEDAREIARLLATSPNTSPAIRDILIRDDLEHLQSNGFSASGLDDVKLAVFCEFPSLMCRDNKMSMVNVTTSALHWRNAAIDILAEHNGIKVGLLEQSPLRVAHDYYSLDEDCKERFNIYKTVTDIYPVGILRSQQNSGHDTPVLPFPVGTSLICGGPGSGKSFSAIQMALIAKDYDVVFANYKTHALQHDSVPRNRHELGAIRLLSERFSPGRTRFAALPQQVSAVFAQLREAESMVLYTEVSVSDDTDLFIDELLSAKKRHDRRGLLIVFDEIFNSKVSDPIGTILRIHNTFRTEKVFAVAIHQQLAYFHEDRNKPGGPTLCEAANLILCQLSRSDSDAIDLALSRVPRNGERPPLVTVTRSDVLSQERGDFVLSAKCQTICSYPWKAAMQRVASHNINDQPVKWGEKF